MIADLFFLSLFHWEYNPQINNVVLLTVSLFRWGCTLSCFASCNLCRPLRISEGAALLLLLDPLDHRLQTLPVH